MGQRAVLEEEVGEPIQVFHLDIGASEHIRLLITLNQPNRDVRLFNCEFVCLLSDDADHITELALDGELSDGPNHELSLVRRDHRANAQRAQIAQGQEKLFHCLVRQDVL